MNLGLSLDNTGLRSSFSLTRDIGSIWCFGVLFTTDSWRDKTETLPPIMSLYSLNLSTWLKNFREKNKNKETPYMLFLSSALCRPKHLHWVVFLVGIRRGCVLLQVGLEGMRCVIGQRKCIQKMFKLKLEPSSRMGSRSANRVKNPSSWEGMILSSTLTWKLCWSILSLFQMGRHFISGQFPTPPR